MGCPRFVSIYSISCFPTEDFIPFGLLGHVAMKGADDLIFLYVFVQRFFVVSFESDLCIVSDHVMM